MKQLVFKRGDVAVIQGVVTEKIEGTGAGAGKVLSVKIKSDVYNKTTSKNEETETAIAFWNTEKAQNANNANAILNVGDYMSAMVSVSDDGKYTALAFKKNNARYQFKAEEGKAEYNVFVGRVGYGFAADDHYTTKMNVDVAAGKSDQYSISFWNGREGNPNLGTNAQKCLAPYVPKSGKTVYRSASIICGPVNTYIDKNGEEQKGCTAFSFDRN
jgi:hypothetical protein